MSSLHCGIAGSEDAQLALWRRLPYALRHRAHEQYGTAAAPLPEVHASPTLAALTDPRRATPSTAVLQQLGFDGTGRCSNALVDMEPWQVEEVLQVCRALGLH